jgi:hypothetical protein
MGQVSRRGDIGEQDETACLCLQAGQALGLGAHGCLQSIAHGCDRARLLEAGSAPAIHGLFLHSHLPPMVDSAYSADPRRRGCRISAAAILLLLSGLGRSLDGTIRGLDIPCQSLLPPFVLGAGVDHHGAIRRPVERALALRGSLFRTFGACLAALPTMGDPIVGACPVATGGLWVADVSRCAP